MTDSKPAGTPRPLRRGHGTDNGTEFRLPPGRSVLPREVINSHQRDRILNAMLANVVDHGYPASSVSRVAKYAGVSTATFYQLFTDREDAFGQMYDVALAALLDPAIAIWNTDDKTVDAPTLLRRCLDTLLDTVAANPDLARAALAEASWLGLNLFERLHRQLDHFTETIERAMRDHNASPAPQFAARAIVTTAYDLIEEHAIAGTTDQLPARAEDLYVVSLALFESAAPDADSPDGVSADALARYQESLDHVYALCPDMIAEAPSWQSGLYASLRACYTEMRSHPESLRLHFIETARDEGVETIRTAHRTRLLMLLHELRDDAPAKQDAVDLLQRIHRVMREQIISNDGGPIDFDDADHTFATLLFDHKRPVSSTKPE